MSHRLERTLVSRYGQHRVALGAVGLAVAAASTSAILIRAGDAPEPVMAFYRVVFTTLFLLPFAGQVRGELAETSRRDLLGAVVAGLALAAHFTTWFASVDLTSVAASVTLVQTQTLFVAIGAGLFLRERITRAILGGIAVALGGSVLMSVEGLLSPGSAPAPLLGNGLALVGAIAAAAYVLSGRSIRQRVAVVPYVVVVYSVAAIGLLGVVLAGGHPLFSYPLHEWLLFLGMAIGPGVVGHTLINWALEHVESSVVSVSLVGEPVGSTALALLLFGEVPGVLTLLGGVVVIGGIVLTARARRA